MSTNSLIQPITNIHLFNESTYEDVEIIKVNGTFLEFLYKNKRKMLNWNAVLEVDIKVK